MDLSIENALSAYLLENLEGIKIRRELDLFYIYAIPSYLIKQHFCCSFRPDDHDQILCCTFLQGHARLVRASIYDPECFPILKDAMASWIQEVVNPDPFHKRMLKALAQDCENKMPFLKAWRNYLDTCARHRSDHKSLTLVQSWK